MGTRFKRTLGRRNVAAGPDLEAERYLTAIRTALLAEGFHGTLAQIRRRGQVFGLVKDFPGHRQMHIRAFTDGRLEAEVEFSRRCVNHWLSPRDPAHVELSGILDRLGLSPRGVNPGYRPYTGQNREWPEACLDLRVKQAVRRAYSLGREAARVAREQGLRAGVRFARGLEPIPAAIEAAAEQAVPTPADER